MASDGTTMAPPSASVGHPHRPIRTALWSLVVCAGLWGALSGLPEQTGPIAAFAGLVVATLPVPAYLAAVLWIDRWEREPARLLVTGFFWGAAIATFVSGIVNGIVGLVAGEAAAAVVSAPIVEEGMKGLGLIRLARRHSDEFDGVADVVVYAAVIGLGFAWVENVTYYAQAALEGGGEGLAGIAILRGLLAPFSHPLFTSLTGVGIGLGLHRRPAARRLLILLGLACAMFLHALWNASASQGEVFLSTYVAVMVPMFLGMVVASLVSVRRAGLAVATYLHPSAGASPLTADDVESLRTGRRRRKALKAAKRAGGRPAKRTHRRWQQAAVELAYARRRAARSGRRADALVEARYADEIQRLRSVA